MIDSITGTLEGLELAGVPAARVRVEGGLTYLVLLTAYSAARLGADLGRPITLYTAHWLDSQDQGTSFTPRLAGFVSVEDREFYELFISCKGIGRRRGLKAMALDTGRLAVAIADRDLATLQALPEIGRRLAETIVATLHRKVDAFVSAAAFGGAASQDGHQTSTGKGKKRGSGGESTGPDAEQARAAAQRASMAREALEALMQLGEDRLTAIRLIDRVLSAPDDRPTTTQQLLAKVFAVRGSP